MRGLHLTEVEQKVFDTILEYSERYGQSPTLEELMGFCGYKSKRSITQILEQLESKYRITRIQNKRRNIKIGICKQQITVNVAFRGVIKI